MPPYPYGLPPEYIPLPPLPEPWLPPMDPVVTDAYPLASVATVFAGLDGAYEVFLRHQGPSIGPAYEWEIIDVGESMDIGRHRFSGGHDRSAQWRRRQAQYLVAPGIWVRAILTPPDVVGSHARDAWRRAKEAELRAAYAAQGRELCGLIP